MKFSALLQRFREEKGVSKKDLADKIGVTPTYIGLLESGTQRAPTMERCREISGALDLSTGDAARLADSAMEERLPPDALQWHLEKIKAFNFTNGKLEESPEIDFASVPLYSLKDFAKMKKSSPLPKADNRVLVPSRRGSKMIAVSSKDEVFVVDQNERPGPGDFVLVSDGNGASIKRYSESKEIAIVMGVVVMTIKKYK